MNAGLDVDAPNAAGPKTPSIRVLVDIKYFRQKFLSIFDSGQNGFPNLKFKFHWKFFQISIFSKSEKIVLGKHVSICTSKPTKNLLATPDHHADSGFGSRKFSKFVFNFYFFIKKWFRSALKFEKFSVLGIEIASKTSKNIRNRVQTSKLFPH